MAVMALNEKQRRALWALQCAIAGLVNAPRGIRDKFEEELEVASTQFSCEMKKPR